jgi:hypothetical protein
MSSPAPGTALTAFDPKQLALLDEVASQCEIAVREAGNNISGALAVAENMQKLRQLVTPQMLHSLAALQNTSLGFRTDRAKAKSGPKEYSPEELRDPFIEATVRGFRAVGNEFNVIAGNFYGAKAGFERKVRTFPGLSNFAAFYDVEETAGGFARVQCVATWVLDGQHDEFTRRKESIKGKPFDNRIRVRVNEGMGYDALLGKAQRKFFAAVWDHLINADTATPEGDPDDIIVDPEAGKSVRRSQLFDDKPVEDPDGPKESAQDDLVDGYRNKLAAIAAKSDVSGIAREAGKDTTLNPRGRAAVMALCSEAMKLWPNRIAAPASETARDLSGNEGAEVANRVAEKELAGAGGDSTVDVDLDQAVMEYREEAARLETAEQCDDLEGHAKSNRALIDAHPAMTEVLKIIAARRGWIVGSQGQQGNGSGPATSLEPLEWTTRQAARCATFGDWKKLEGQIAGTGWPEETKSAARKIVADAKAARKGSSGK